MFYHQISTQTIMNFARLRQITNNFNLLTKASVYYKVLDKNMMCTTDLTDKTRYNFGLNILPPTINFFTSQKSDIEIKPETDGIYEANISSGPIHELILTKKYNVDNIETYFHFNKDVIFSNVEKVQSDIIGKTEKSILSLETDIKENVAIWNDFIKKSVSSKNFMNFVMKHKLHLPKFYLASYYGKNLCLKNKELIDSSPKSHSVYRCDSAELYTLSTVENLNLDDNIIYNVQLYPENIPETVVNTTETHGICKTDAMMVVERQHTFDVDELLTNNSDILEKFISNNDLSKVIALIGDIRNIKYVDVDKYKNFIQLIQSQSGSDMVINHLTTNNLQKLKIKKINKVTEDLSDELTLLIITAPIWIAFSPLILPVCCFLYPKIFFKYFSIPVILIALYFLICHK